MIILKIGIISSSPHVAAYSTVVKSINEHRISHKPFNALKSFEAASAMIVREGEHQSVHACWNLLGKLLGSDLTAPGQNLDLTLLPGHFTKVYSTLSDATPNEDAIRFRTQLVQGGKEWLQESYRSWVSDHVRKQRYEIGGVSFSNLRHAYSTHGS